LVETIQFSWMWHGRHRPMCELSAGDDPDVVRVLEDGALHVEEGPRAPGRSQRVRLPVAAV
jgi:hypothetical protein